MTSQLDTGHVSRQDVKAQCYTAPGATLTEFIIKLVARFRIRKVFFFLKLGGIARAFCLFVLLSLYMEVHSLCPRSSVNTLNSCCAETYNISNIFDFFFL